MKMSNTNNENKTLKKAKKARVIPGFGLTMGVTVTMLSLIVLIPLASVFAYALKLSPNEFLTLISKRNSKKCIYHKYRKFVYCSIDQCCVWVDHCMGACKV